MNSKNKSFKDSMSYKALVGGVFVLSLLSIPVVPVARGVYEGRARNSRILPNDRVEHNLVDADEFLNSPQNYSGDVEISGRYVTHWEGLREPRLINDMIDHSRLPYNSFTVKIRPDHDTGLSDSSILCISESDRGFPNYNAVSEFLREGYNGEVVIQGSAKGTSPFVETRSLEFNLGGFNEIDPKKVTRFIEKGLATFSDETVKFYLSDQ